MSILKASASQAQVIGDLVGSRQVADRRSLHRALKSVLDRVNEQIPTQQGFRITVGDEFQGSCGELGQALRATLLIRVGMAEWTDVRHGIGWGAVQALDEQVQDGPGWWAARAAIEEVKLAEARPAIRSARTFFRAAPGSPDTIAGAEAAVNMALMGRDHLVGMLSQRSMRLLAGMLAGQTQQELAESEGISASAVSQRVRHDGLGVLLAMQDLWTDAGRNGR